ncbi:hypothetical protein ACFLYK_01170 [Candidatus Cloacimonadota bacterium]
MKLEIGLIGTNPGWETVLQQLGVTYKILEAEEIGKSTLEPAFMIIHNLSKIKDPEVIKDRIKSGGSILFESVKYAAIFKRKIRYQRIKYLFPQSDSIFNNLGLIDFNTTFSIEKNKARKYLDKQLYIISEIIGEGFVTVLPFELNKVLNDTRSCRLRFPAERDELPSEIVSKVSKGKIRRLIQILLKGMYQQKELPFIQKWYWNSNRESCFSFRVDTDYCTTEQARELYALCLEKGINGTWFIDTGSEDRIKDIYAGMMDQEIAFHCDRHRIFKDKATNDKFITMGLDKLALHNLSVSGYAAPFGEWNKSLAEVLAEKSFEYSSEFALNYDDLPFFPNVGKGYNVLQIPIHPISLGRLRRSHFSRSEMIQYYKALIDRKLAEQEPIIIYHHPAHLHLDVFKEIFSYVNSLDLPKMNFEQLSVWWKFRDSIDLKAAFFENKLKLDSDDKVDYYIKISYKDQYSILPFQNKIDLDKIEWKQEKLPVMGREHKDIRKWHWRDLLYNFESYKGKLKR